MIGCASRAGVDSKSTARRSPDARATKPMTAAPVAVLAAPVSVASSNATTQTEHAASYVASRSCSEGPSRARAISRIGWDAEPSCAPERLVAKRSGDSADESARSSCKLPGRASGVASNLKRASIAEVKSKDCGGALVWYGRQPVKPRDRGALADSDVGAAGAVLRGMRRQARASRSHRPG